jgi:hypothetical protein
MTQKSELSDVSFWAKRAMRASFVHPQEASYASLFRDPDVASDASGRKDLGQLRVSEAGTGFRDREADLSWSHRAQVSTISHRPRLIPTIAVCLSE